MATGLVHVYVDLHSNLPGGRKRVRVVPAGLLLATTTSTTTTRPTTKNYNQ